MKKQKTVWAWVTTHTANADGETRIKRVKIAMQYRFAATYGFWGI